MCSSLSYNFIYNTFMYKCINLQYISNILAYFYLSTYKVDYYSFKNW